MVARMFTGGPPSFFNYFNVFFYIKFYFGKTLIHFNPNKLHINLTTISQDEVEVKFARLWTVKFPLVQKQETVVWARKPLKMIFNTNTGSHNPKENKGTQ